SLIVLGATVLEGHKYMLMVVLFALPVLSGASGGTVRPLLPDQPQDAMVKSMLFGSMGGLIATLLYLVAPTVTGAAEFPPTRPLATFIFSFLLGLVGGLSSDLVFRKLRD